VTFHAEGRPNTLFGRFVIRTLTGDEIVEKLDGVVHDKTQVGPFWVDLTVAEIHRYTKRGCLDFGGSEQQAAASKALHPRKKRGDDNYGWWELHQGVYRIVYNETVGEVSGSLIQLSPHPRLLEAGAQHPTCSFAGGEILSSVLHVAHCGCAIKENSRVSRLQIWTVEALEGDSRK
jgi:hypothetical protein